MGLKGWKSVVHGLRAYHVALNFCGSLIFQKGDFLCFEEINFCDWEKLVFLAGN